jgi:hypothetical protein
MNNKESSIYEFNGKQYKFKNSMKKAMLRAKTRKPEAANYEFEITKNDDDEIIYYKFNGKQYKFKNSMKKAMLRLKAKESNSLIRKPGSFFKLPEHLELKRACINIKNTKDDKCFIWALLAYKHYTENPKTNKDSLMYYKEFEHEIIKPEGQTFPINIKIDIPKFEELNNIKINVYEYIEEGKQLNVIYNSGIRKKNIINILKVSGNEIFRLVWIKNLSRLLSEDTSIGRNKRYHCNVCLSASYTNIRKLKSHRDTCMIEV